jgi:hypothetical protein
VEWGHLDAGALPDRGTVAGLGFVMEDVALGSALLLGIQGLVIAVVCGGAGVRKGLAAKA